ncbi:unnamed protein product, partial [Allacma fusca]
CRGFPQTKRVPRVDKDPKSC